MGSKSKNASQYPFKKKKKKGRLLGKGQSGEQQRKNLSRFWCSDPGIQHHEEEKHGHRKDLNCDLKPMERDNLRIQQK